MKFTQAYRFALDRSRMNGSRAKARRLLAGPAVTTVVVEHKDRLAA